MNINFLFQNIFHLYDVVLTTVIIQGLGHVAIAQRAAYVAAIKVGFTIIQQFSSNRRVFIAEVLALCVIIFVYEGLVPLLSERAFKKIGGCAAFAKYGT